MARITIRIDDELYAHLAGQALVAGQGTATYCRSVLERFEGAILRATMRASTKSTRA
ncbi:hypothetical protein ACFSLT_29155 [Novosphingobium resinovorum]